MIVNVEGSRFGGKGCVSDFLFDFEKLFDALLMLELLLNFEHLAMQFGVLELSPVVDQLQTEQEVSRHQQFSV